MGIYDKTNSAVERLEYLRGELMSERISTGELLELQGLVKHIAPGDVELLEAAGVPEFPAQDTEGIYTTEEQAVIEGLRNKGYCVIIWTPEEMARCTESPRRLEEAIVSHAHDYFFEDEGDPETDRIFAETARNGETGFDVDIDLTPAQNLDMSRSGLFMSEEGSARFWVWEGTNVPATEPQPGEEETGDDVCDICGRSGVTCSRTTADGRTMGNECGCSEEGDEN